MGNVSFCIEDDVQFIGNNFDGVIVMVIENFKIIREKLYNNCDICLF